MVESRIYAICHVISPNFMNQHIDLVAFSKGEPAESNTLGYYLDQTEAIRFSDQLFICHEEQMQDSSLSDIFILFSPLAPLPSFCVPNSCPQLPRKLKVPAILTV